MWEASGVSRQKLIEILIEIAMKRYE
jgi:hypothetical protein